MESVFIEFFLWSRSTKFGINVHGCFSNLSMKVIWDVSKCRLHTRGKIVQGCIKASLHNHCLPCACARLSALLTSVRRWTSPWGHVLMNISSLKKKNGPEFTTTPRSWCIRNQSHRLLTQLFGKYLFCQGPRATVALVLLCWLWLFNFFSHFVWTMVLPAIWMLKVLLQKPCFKMYIKDQSYLYFFFFFLQIPETFFNKVFLCWT